MSATTVDNQLVYESRVRRRQAIIAVLAGVLLVGSAIMQLSGPHTNVDEITLGLIEEHKRFALDLVGAIVQAAAWLGVGWTLTFLYSAARARDAQVQPFIRYLPLIGAPMTAVGIVGYIASYGIKAQDFKGSQTYQQANHLLSATPLTVFQILDYAGELLLAVSFVLISLQAMRVGLLTRFMGYLGIIGGILVLFVITPVPIVQSYWLVALGVLLAGRWPTGTPPAWSSGRAEKWPSSQQLREQRTQASNGRQRVKAGTKPAPETVGAGAGTAAAKGPRATTPKRKRKRRK